MSISSDAGHTGKPSGEGGAARSITDEAYQAIQRQIIAGELKPYQLISEKDLAKQFDCGRTPVREALQRLSFEGFVEILPRRGILVTPIDINRQLELLETRRPLEELMVRLAAKRATQEQRERMIALADGLEKAVATNRRDQYLDINKAVHAIEAEAAGNRFLQQHIGLLHNMSRRFWFSFIVNTASFSGAAHLHAKTLRAIAEGDAESAARSCGELLDVLESATRDAIIGNKP